ncbi:MAG: MFS transporter, partial [Victivallaceae bacterium]|nr:MFS transporter [Victivallaceae bacterium]
MSKNHPLQLTLHDGFVFGSFSGYACCTIALPLVLTALARDLGFSLEAGNKGLGGFLQMAISVCMVLSMLCCGFMAGRWGKRLSLAWANILLALGIMATALAPGYWSVAFSLAIAGIGEGILEGLLTPYLQECHPAEPTRYMNIGQAFSPGGMLLMVILAAVLPRYGATWRTLVLICGLLTLIPGMLLLFPRAGSPVRNPADVLDFNHVSRQFWSVVRKMRFWWFFLAMFFTGVGAFCITFWIASYLQLEFQAGEMLSAFSVGTWCFAMFCGRIGFGAWVQEKKLYKALLFCGVITLLLTPLIPLAASTCPKGIAIGIIFLLLGLCGLAVAP